MAWKKSSPALKAMFDASVPSTPDVERRQMFGYPAAFVNGSLFMGLHQEDFILRLDAENRARLIDIGGRPFAPIPGREMREYAVLPVDILEDATALAMWILRAVTFSRGIKAKPKRKKRNPVKRRKQS